MTVRHNQRAPTPNGRVTGGATDLVETILRTAQQLRRMLNEQLEECDLNDVRFAVLSLVSRTADRGGCSQAELAASLDQSESSISMLVDRMRADRLLHRLHAPTDRRRRRLVLTDEGRVLHDKARLLYASFVDRLLDFTKPDSALRQHLVDFATSLSDSRLDEALHPAATADATLSQSAVAASNTVVKTTSGPSEVSPAA